MCNTGLGVDRPGPARHDPTDTTILPLPTPIKALFPLSPRHYLNYHYIFCRGLPVPAPAVPQLEEVSTVAVLSIDGNMRDHLKY